MDAARLLGDEATFEYDGTTWTLVPWDRYGIQKHYMIFLKRRAWDSLAPEASGLDDERYGLSAAALAASIAIGDYEWKGPVWAKSLARLLGIEQILWLTLKVKHKDVEMATVQKMLEAKGAEISALLQRLVQDPNLQAPAPALTV